MACEGFAERAGGVGFGVLFVIFLDQRAIQRLEAAKEDRRMCFELQALLGQVNTFDEKKDIKKTTHCHVVSDFEDKFSL
jgi:hypothetical protein